MPSDHSLTMILVFDSDEDAISSSDSFQSHGDDIITIIDGNVLTAIVTDSVSSPDAESLVPYCSVRYRDQIENFVDMWVISDNRK